MKKTILTIIICIICIICFFTNYSLATDYFATALGSSEVNGDKEGEIKTAASAYSNVGYRTTCKMDPSSTLMMSNMMARVIYVTCHGAVRAFEFPSCGLKMDNTSTSSSKEFFKTNSINWENGLLFTVAACNSGGTDGELTLDSIAGDIAVNGVNMTVGFTTEINPYSMVNWSARYNNQLGNYYILSSAIDYANSFSYVNNNVKNNCYFYHDNIYSISTAVTASNDIKKMNSEMEERNILKERKENNIQNNMKNINNIIYADDQKFNSDNYEVQKTRGSIGINVNTKEKTTGKEYIDYIFKVGDFLTNYGYTIVSVNNEIEAIYDNNLSDSIRDDLISKSDLFIADSNKEKEFLEKAKLELNSKEKCLMSNTTYYYDVENDKKYIIIDLELEKTNLTRSISYNDYKTIMYEI